MINDKWRIKCKMRKINIFDFSKGEEDD